MNPEVINVVLVGVGGQGSVLAGQIIAQAAQSAGFAVAASEVHGMAQRGGSVCSSVRYGDQVLSPTVSSGQADFLLAFEKLEALRHLSFLKPSGVVLVNDQQITPTVESLKLAPYPEDIDETLSTQVEEAWIVPGLEIANRLGNPKLANTVLLGALSTLLALPEKAWQRALEAWVPPKTVDLNLQAFAEGVAWSQANQRVKIKSER